MRIRCLTRSTRKVRNGKALVRQCCAVLRLSVHESASEVNRSGGDMQVVSRHHYLVVFHPFVEQLTVFYTSGLVLASSTQQNIHRSVTGCGHQHPVTDPYTLRYRPGKVHVAYRLYIRICAALIQYKYGTDLLYGSVTDVLSYVLYTNCIYMSVRRCKIQVWYRHFIHICDRYVIISIVYKLYSQVCTVMQNTGIVQYS